MGWLDATSGPRANPISLGSDEMDVISHVRYSIIGHRPSVRQRGKHRGPRPGSHGDSEMINRLGSQEFAAGRVVDLRSCELLRGGCAPQAALFTNLHSKRAFTKPSWAWKLNCSSTERTYAKRLASNTRWSRHPITIYDISPTRHFRVEVDSSPIVVHRTNRRFLCHPPGRDLLTEAFCGQGCISALLPGSGYF